MTALTDALLLRALAADLDDADFRSAVLRGRWREVADGALGRSLQVPALREIRADRDELATLARLLIFAVPQVAGAVARALPRSGVEGLVQLGLATHTGGVVTPRAVLRPQSFEDDSGEGEWWVISDLDELALGEEPLAEQHVLGVGGASLALAGITIPTPAASLLDLGTGCGVQALRGARFAKHIVATDVSERALRFAGFNAVLNDVTIEVRAGSLFDPVTADGEPETFERIVSNPPFVITPRAERMPSYEYRDAGLIGDALMHQVISGVGAHLKTGGVAQLLGNWESIAGDEGLSRVQSWVEASSVPLDAWVVERESLDPVRYAEMWIRDGGTTKGSAEYNRMLDAWLDDFEARGVTAIGFGSILLRRTDRPALARYERVLHAVPQPASLGAHISAALEAHDRVEELGDSGLLAAPIIRGADVTEARHYVPGNEHPSVIELRQTTGYGRTVSVDAALAALVGASDGELSVGQTLHAIAELLEVPADALIADTLPGVRRLIIDGFLAFE